MLKQLLIISSLSSGILASTPDLPQNLTSVWNEFQSAIKTNNIDKLAKITKFPLEYNEIGGKIKSSSDLKNRYKTIFSAKTKECLLSSKLQREELDGKIYYQVLCQDTYPLNFTFEKVGSKYFLTSIDNINE
jgi:hypothetical protein